MFERKYWAEGHCVDIPDFHSFLGLFRSGSGTSHGGSALFEHSAQHSMIEADSVEHSAQLPPPFLPGKCLETRTIFALKHAHLPRIVGSIPTDCLENRSRGDCKLSMIVNTDRPDSDFCAPNVWTKRRNCEPRRTFSPIFGSSGEFVSTFSAICAQYGSFQFTTIECWNALLEPCFLNEKLPMSMI